MTPLSGAAANLDYSLDVRVLLFTLGLSLLSALGVGLAPALASVRTRVTDALRHGSRRNWRRGSRLRAILVSGQLALSVVLLSGAGLYVRTLMSYGQVDPGFDAEQVAAVSIALDAETYPEPRARAFLGDLLDRAERIPGVRAAGYGDPVPLQGSRMSTAITVPGLEPPEGRDGFIVDLRAVTPDYLQTMGIPVLTGRGITAQDRVGTEPVAVVNQTMAERFWPDGAVGKTFYESDCQGRTDPSLIARLSCLLQSAPAVRSAKCPVSFGRGTQSSSAWLSSFWLQVRWDSLQAAGSQVANHGSI